MRQANLNGAGRQSSGLLNREPGALARRVGSTRPRVYSEAEVWREAEPGREAPGRDHPDETGPAQGRGGRGGGGGPESDTAPPAERPQTFHASRGNALSRRRAAPDGFAGRGLRPRGGTEGCWAGPTAAGPLNWPPGSGARAHD